MMKTSNALFAPSREPAAAPPDGSRARLRLLHVAPFPPPWSGIGVAVQNLLASSAISAQANWVISTSQGSLPAPLGRTKRPTARRVLRHLMLAASTVSMIRKHDIQVVHLHGSSHDLSFVANGLAVAVGRAAGARVVWHLHQDLTAVQFPGTRSLTRAVFKAAMRSTDILAVLTDRDSRVAGDLVSPSKVVILPPSCSAEFLEIPMRRPSETVRVLYVGWLTGAKGIYDLLQVALSIRARAPQVTFNVLGTERSPGEGDLIRAFIQHHSLESKLNLCGVVVGEVKRKMFAEADLLVMPTHHDAFPLAVLEAMAAGLPVLATNVGGLPAMVGDGRGARLVEPGDVTAFTEHLIDLARDGKLRMEMGRINREHFAAHYHPDRAGETALDLYRRLVCKA